MTVAPGRCCWCHEMAKESPELAEYLCREHAQYGQSLRPVLLSTGPKRPTTLTFETYVDAEHRFAHENDLPDTVLMLVRPDGYIAWLGKGFTDDLDRYFDRWLR